MYSSSVCVKIHLERLRYNLRILRSRYPNVMPVVKANAYGHGIMVVANVLRDEGVQHMAVGSITEGFLLRKEGHQAFLLALLGPFSEEDARIAILHNITPVIHNIESLQYIVNCSRLHQGGVAVPVAIKIDTGMGRLGFSSNDYVSLIDLLRHTPEVNPILLISHLVAPEISSFDNVTYNQVEQFVRAYKAIKEVFPTIKTSLTNSPGLLAWPNYIGDFSRPGIALYGGNPFYGTSRVSLGKGFLPVMEVEAPVIAINTVSAGSSIGYGCTYYAKEDIRVAVIGAGYADGYSRSFSNKGWVVIKGKRYRIVGKVCMQMLMVDITSGHRKISIGDKAFLLGGGGSLAIKPEELAEWWGTIPHEVCCSLGSSIGVQQKQLVIIGDSYYSDTF